MPDHELSVLSLLIEMDISIFKSNQIRKSISETPEPIQFIVLFSRVLDSVTPWTVAHQAPLSIGILQARILECVSMPSSRGSFQPRDQTQVDRIAGKFFIN